MPSRFMRKCICRLRLNKVSRQWRRRPKLPPNASCSCISCSPTGCPPRGGAGRRPASGRSSRPGTSPARASADGSPGSAARSRCWYGCASSARWEKRSRSAFPQCRPHSRRSPPKQQLFRTSAPVAAQVDAVHVDVWIVPALQRAVAPVFNVDVGFLVQLYNFLGHSLLSPFRMVCGNFILPEPACYVFFYAIFNLRTLLYIIIQ